MKAMEWRSTLAFYLAIILESNQDLDFETQNASEIPPTFSSLNL